MLQMPKSTQGSDQSSQTLMRYIDDLYNNLRVYEDEMKRSSSSTSTSQNLAFLSTGEHKQYLMNSTELVEILGSGRNQGKRSYGDNGRSNAPTNESSSQALVAQDGLGGYDWSNDFEVEPVNYALMAISSSSSSSSSDNEVQKCSKQCLESFKTLQKNYDSEREKHSRARLEIQGYELALESLESRILVHEKNELAWGEKYEFQNYELKCREIKINNLNLELEKVVKERDELKLKIEKWEESSKNLDELLNSQMSARDKTGLGYGTQLNEMSNNSETDSEISLSVFDVRSSDEESTPANDRFSKADGFHAVPPPIIGNFLTPRADISFAGLDEYAIRKKIIKSKTTDLNTKTSETVGKTNEANTQKPKTVYESVNRDKVIIEDWNSDDEDDVSEVQTVSPVKTNETQTVKTRVDKIGQTSQKQGIGFKKIKACFVCKSTDHLIKDYNFHDKQSQESKLKTMVNTGPRTFVPSGVLTITGLITPVKQNKKRAVHTVGTARPVSTAKSVSTARLVSTASYTGKGKMDTDLKKLRWVLRPKGHYLDHVSKDSGSFMLKKGNPEILLQDHAMVDSGCSSHMTGNKAYLSDYEDYNGGFMAFGSDPKGGKITGKGNIRIANLDFDDVYFVDELKAPRKDDVYSLDLKNIIPSGGECGIAKKHDERVSSDEDVDEWLNAEIGKPKIGQDKDEEEDALIDILKTVVEECFTLPGTISNLKIYVMADVGAGINIMPKSLFEHLKLTNLKKTNMVVEMADMTKKAPLGIVENIPVKIDKFLFCFDFVVIDMLEGPNETKLLDLLDKHSKECACALTTSLFNALTNQHETQPDLSPRPLPTIPILDSIPEGSSGNHGGQSSSDRSLSGNEDGLTLQSVYDLCVSLCKQVTDQAKEIKHLKAQIKKLKKKAKPVITHHKAWMKSVSMKQRLAGKKSLKKKWMQKESVSKQGRKLAKAEPTVHKDPAFDDLDDIMDYMESEDAQDEGRTSYVVLEEKESAQKGVSTEVEVSTVKPDKGTGKSKVSIDKPEVSTAKPKEVEVSTDKLDEGTAEPKDGTSDESTTPTTVFRDDETIAEFLVSMSQNKAKQKSVEIKDAKDSDRPRATSTISVLTLKPLPKIDPKDKGKKVLEEEAERNFDQLAKDEEIARKVQEDWEAEEEMKKLAVRLQEEERETFTVEERAKFLYDTIAAQRRFLAQQRVATIRSRPPTRTQLRNQIMTYLKHVGGKKHADLKNKNFEEIQVMYKKVKRSNKDFIAIGYAEDERQIKEMNKESKDPKKKKVVNETLREEDTAKVPAEQEVTEQSTMKRKSGHVKMIARIRPRPQPNDDSDDKHRKCLRIVTFDSTLDSEIMETKSFVSKLHKVSSPDGDYLVVYRVNGNFRAFNYLMEVLHIFDRQDLFHLYDLVMKQYSEITPEDWEIFRWRLYEACGVCILELKDGTVIYMLVERRLSIRLVVYNEELAIPEQTATGKGISNPLMDCSLPKTTKTT
ncbi:ribonuclease H-like domain-containing protein [Tanacetum coccineum]